MARRCTTVPGFGLCCQASQAGKLNQPIRFNTTHGQRCGVCTTRPSQSKNPAKAGRTVFQFRFAPGSQCGLGAGGCPTLTQGTPAGGQGTLLIQ